VSYLHPEKLMEAESENGSRKIKYERTVFSATRKEDEEPTNVKLN
jgi:hypothetical protein